MAAFAHTRTLDVPLADAEARVRAALSDEGFGVLTEVDIQATLHAKLGVEMAPYTILGACHPPSAHRALEAEPLIGTMLPCNVVLRGVEGGTEVAAVDPVASMAAVENDALGEIAGEIRDALRRAVDAA